MKHIAMVATLVALGLVGVSEARATQLYAGGDAGWNFILGNGKFNDDLIYGGAVGVDFGGPALEFTVNYSSFNANNPTNAIVQADFNVVNLGLVGRYNLDLKPLRPYLLVGASYNIGDFSNVVSIPKISSSLSKSQNEWGFIGGGGLELMFGDHISIGPDVRYNLIFTSAFNTANKIRATDLGNYPDFLQITGRLNLYF